MIGVPLELAEDLDGKKVVVWTDNGDGSYTLRPRDEL